MQAFLTRLNSRLQFVNSSWFYILFGSVLFVQPLAIWIQAYKAYTVSVEGVSVLTFIIMGCLQIVGMLYGVRQMDWRIILAMVASVLASFAIVLRIIFL